MTEKSQIMRPDFDPEIVESPSTELSKVLAEGDPQAQLALLEKKAELAPRWNRAISTILVTQTYPEDWTEQGGKMCLSSAGAERVARLFSIRFVNTRSRREDFTDAIGAAYRYIFECEAIMGDRSVFAQGSYGTRDKFLAYASGEWRAVEDINENNIRNAAYHICMGNAIKALLGLRSIPASRFKEIMAGAGEDAGKASSVRRGAGTQGGTSADESVHQKELAEICIYVANGGYTVGRGDDGRWKALPMSEGDDRSEMERAKGICVALSGFTGKDGKQITGLPASQLKAKRLEVTLGTARAVKAGMDSEADHGR